MTSIPTTIKLNFFNRILQNMIKFMTIADNWDKNKDYDESWSWETLWSKTPQ